MNATRKTPSTDSAYASTLMRGQKVKTVEQIVMGTASRLKVEDGRGSTRRVQESAQHLESGCLPRAVRTEESNHFPGLDLEGDFVHRLDGSDAAFEESLRGGFESGFARVPGSAWTIEKHSQRETRFLHFHVVIAMALARSNQSPVLPCPMRRMLRRELRPPRNDGGG